MLFSLLANIIGLASLISLPLISTPVIDVSNFTDGGRLILVKTHLLKDAPYRLNNYSLGMKVTALSAMIVDKKSGAVLWQKNPEAARPLASITKLMTALVFLEHQPPAETEITIQLSDNRGHGLIHVFPGEKIKAQDLFNASLVASLNNATMALVRSTALSEEQFVAAMNEKAKALGMTETVFIEPTGLDPANVSTASDIIKLIKAAFQKPEIVFATTQAEYRFSVTNADRNYTLKNTDKLLDSYLQIKAGKTGYLDEAGYCLAAEVIGHENQEILVVVLGSQTELDRFQDLKALAQWAFDNYYWTFSSS